MAYSLTSAANPKALLAEIVTFAAAQGWTTEYNHADGSGSSVGGQIALTSGNCHIAIGEQSATQNPIAVTGGNDARIYMALATAIVPATIQFWGHTGSIVTTATDTDRVIVNDIAGPMDEVHFFGDSTYITVAIKSAAQRWTTFSFGNLNMKGMASPASGYCWGSYHEWWNIDALSTTNRYYNVTLGSPNDLMPNSVAVEGGGLSLMIPATLLDSAYGFTATAHVITKRSTNKPLGMTYFVTRVEEGEGDNGAASTLLDHVTQIRPQSTTGGIPLFAFPMIYLNPTVDLTSYIGELPGIRACRTTMNSPGDIITYGVEEYFVAPWKQFGTLYDSGNTGGLYNGQPNTYDLAWAILKD